MPGNLVGVDTSLTLTSAELTQGKGYSIGNRFTDYQGNEWVYVIAGGSIPQYQVVTIFASCTAVNFSSAAVIGTTVAPLAYGISASASIASGSYGWIMTRGKSKVRVAASSTGTLSGQLYAEPSANAGLVAITASGNILLKSLYCIATATTSTTASAVPVVFRDIYTST